MKLIPSLPMPTWAAGYKRVTYVCDLCEQPFVTRQQSAQTIGIRVEDNWYCGRRCFTLASEGVITQLLSTSVETGNRVERMPLGLLLASRGHLTKEQLRDVNEEQRRSGEEMGALLLRRALVSEKHVAAARAQQWGCPLYTVPREGANPAASLPAALMQEYAAVPLHYSQAADELLVGFVHSIGYGLLYAIERIVGCRTQAGFVTLSDFQAQIKLQSMPPAGESVFEGLETPLEIAQAVCQAALDLEADEAVFARCRGYVWVRVRRVSASQDLLFKTA